MKFENVKLFINGDEFEAKTAEATLSPCNEGKELINYNWTKSYSGTLENAEIIKLWKDLSPTLRKYFSSVKFRGELYL